MASDELYQSLTVLLRAQVLAGLPPDQQHRADELTKAFIDAAAPLANCVAIIMQLKDLLTRPYGQVLEKTILGEVAAGRLLPSLLMQKDLSKLQREPEPRTVIRAHFYKALEASRSLVPEAADCTNTKVCEIASALERGVFNHVIRACQTQGVTTMRSWDNNAFVSCYSSRASVVLTHIVPDSSVVETYGPTIARRLLLEELSPGAAGGMSAAELCPAAFEREKALIALRSQQTIHQKTSALWVCPNCKARACTFREVQDRSADEPASIYCTCTKCGFHFKGA